MRELPPITSASKYPATSVLGAAAIAATVYWGSGGDIGPVVESTEWPWQPWWLLTSALFHINALHLLFNLYWLWAFGTLLERRYGPLKVASIYVLLAVVSGAAEFAFLHGGVGLSGIGYGLFGLIYVLAQRDSTYADVLDAQTVQLFVGWFFLCIVTTVLKIMPVGNIAHGVGALTGYLLGLAIVNSNPKRMLNAAALALLAVASLDLASVGREYVNFSASVSQDYWQRGIAAIKKGDNESAVKQFKRGIEIDPDEGGLWFNLGIAYQGLQDFESAADAYQHAWNLGEHDENVARAVVANFVYLGDLALALGDWPKAEHDYNAALCVNDTSEKTWKNLAIAYDRQGKKAEAVKALANAAKQSSKAKDDGARIPD
jgi:membrane associated rhomboid family serine protease/Tfp pilus assembly protein PilF